MANKTQAYRFGKKLSSAFIVGQIILLIIATIIIITIPGLLGIDRSLGILFGCATFFVLNTMLVLFLISHNVRSVTQIENYLTARSRGAVISDSSVDTKIGKKALELITSSFDQKDNTKLRDAKNQDYIFRQMPIGIILLDSTGKTLIANDTLYGMLGIVGGESHDIDRVLAKLKFMHQQDLVSWIVKSKRDDIQDSNYWERVSLNTIQNERNVTKVFDLMALYNKNLNSDANIILTLINRTDHYDQMDEPIDFITVAAHELRAPISALRGLIDVFKVELSPIMRADQKGVLRRMEVASKQLSNYVTNILNVAHIDQDAFETTLRKEDWLAIANQTVVNMRDVAETHSRRITAKIPNDLPLVAVDRTAVEHVLTNLIDNAIKYSNENSTVEVVSSLKGNSVETTIHDKGVVIPESLMGHLFTKFYRSHRSKRDFIGSGLGLYLCKIIINAHGGEIWANSDEQNGTTIGFTVPTYDSVAEKIENGDNVKGITRRSHGWIKNHSLYRR